MAVTHKICEVKDEVLSTNKNLVTSTFPFEIVINATLTTLFKVTMEIHNDDVERETL